MHGIREANIIFKICTTVRTTLHVFYIEVLLENRQNVREVTLEVQINGGPTKHRTGPHRTAQDRTGLMHFLWDTRYHTAEFCTPTVNMRYCRLKTFL